MDHFHCGGVFASLLFQFPHEFLGLFGNDPQVIALAAEYGKLVGFATMLNGISFIYIGAYRSIGQPKLGMYLMALSSILNLFLNWVFIYGNLGAPAMGVRGAGLGTLLARMVEVTIVLCHFLTTKGFRLDLKLMLHPGREAVGLFYKHSVTVVTNETLWGIGTAAFPAVMGHMDGSAEILASMAIAQNIERIVMVAGFGLAASTSIIIGRSVGAGESKEKLREIGICLAFWGFVIGAFGGVLLLLAAFFLVPGVVAPLFQLTPAAMEITQVMLVALTTSIAFRTSNSVTVVGILRGGGDLSYSMKVDVLPLWLVAIPLAVLFGLVLRLHVMWVCFAMTMEHFVKFAFGSTRLKTSIWVHDLTQIKKEDAEQEVGV